MTENVFFIVNNCKWTLRWQNAVGKNDLGKENKIYQIEVYLFYKPQNFFEKKTQSELCQLLKKASIYAVARFQGEKSFFTVNIFIQLQKGDQVTFRVKGKCTFLVNKKLDRTVQTGTSACQGIHFDLGIMEKNGITLECQILLLAFLELKFDSTGT